MSIARGTTGQVAREAAYSGSGGGEWEVRKGADTIASSGGPTNGWNVTPATGTTFSVTVPANAVPASGYGASYYGESESSHMSFGVTAPDVTPATIAAGSSGDTPINAGDAPQDSGNYGAWDILNPFGTRIAWDDGNGFGENANGWAVSQPNPYTHLTVSIPADASTGNGYKARFWIASGGGGQSASFNVAGVTPTPPAAPSLSATPMIVNGVPTIVLSGS